MTAEASTGIPEGKVGRYLLEDLVAESKAGTQFWRASDPALRRPVGARLIPVDDPRVPRLRAAARAAAGVHERPIVQVLDVVQTPRFLAVITEWVTGRPWSEVVLDSTQPTDPNDAVIAAYEVALALRAAHALGVPHGRVRPSSVMITESGEVRLRGLQIDAAMYGVAPGSDPFAADLHGVGAILFAGLTNRWPDPQQRAGSLDGIRVVGPVGGRLPTANELIAGVPPELSRIAAACLLPAQSGRRAYRIPDMEHAVAALAAVLGRSPGTGSSAVVQPDRHGASTERLIRLLAVLVTAAIAVAAGTLLLSDVNLGGSAPDEPTPPAPSASSAPPPPAVQPPQQLAIASVTDFDPQGEDGRENPELAPLAIDGDSETAWLTVPYKNSGMDPKDGTGLLVDLGLIRPLREVTLQLVGSGTDVEIRTTTQPGAAADDFELLAGAVAVGPEITIRTPIPVDTRYVLIWLTNLPYGQGAYQGGIRELQILG